MSATAAEQTVRAPDYDAIVRVVQLYVDGFNDHDIAKFREAFDEDAWIYYTGPDGRLYKHLIADSFEGWATDRRGTIKGRIISVRQAGDVANVLLGFDNLDDPSSWWVDFHSLLRINGVWKITNKTATHRSRAGGI